MKKKLFLLLLPFIITIIALVVTLIIYFPKTKIWLSIAIILASLIIEIPLSVILHEAGHLVFGLLTGYKLAQFRFLFITITKEEKLKIKFSHMNLLALGQCVMYPPKYNKKKKPKFFLYNAGGLIFTYSLTLIGLLLMILIPNNFVKLIFILLFVINLYFSLTNSVVTEGGYNDMCNFAIVKKTPEKLLDILYSLEVTKNVLRNKGYSGKTTYPVYVEKPYDHIVFPVILFKIYGAFEKNNFEIANKYYELLKKSSYTISHPLHRALSTLEIAYCDLVLAHNYKNFVRHFRGMDQIGLKILEKAEPTLYDYYLILKDISEGKKSIIDKIDQLDSENDLNDYDYKNLHNRLMLLEEELQRVEF